MVKITHIVTALLLAGLFAVALIAGGVQLASMNHANQSIINDSQFNSVYVDLSGNLTKSSTDAYGADAAISNSSLSTIVIVPFVDSVVGIWKTMT